MANLFIPLVSVILLAHLLQVKCLSGTCNSYEREILNEGYSPHVYINTQGYPIVGIGFNLNRADAWKQLYAVGADYYKIRDGSANLTDYQIKTLFHNNMADAVSFASSWVPQVWERMSNDQRSAVADMAFSMGWTSMVLYHGGMKSALLRGDYGGAVASVRISEWCRKYELRCNRDIACMKGGLAKLMEILGLNR